MEGKAPRQGLEPRTHPRLRCGRPWHGVGLTMLKLPTSMLLLASLMACALPIPIGQGFGTGGPGGSPIAPAPEVPTEVDPAFCTSTAGELMPALDGTWRLTGGTRTFWGGTEQGSITMRIAPQEPEDVVLEYLPERGFMRGLTPDGEIHMFLFPATDAQIEAAGPLIGEDAPGPGCDWYDSPLFIGTNYYYGNEALETVDVGRWAPACSLLRLSVDYFDPERCREPDPDEYDFEMEMTVVVRFSGSSHASGMLYHEGAGLNPDVDDDVRGTTAEFRARATVELTR